MSLPFGTMGAIALSAIKKPNAPRDWAFCNGQKLEVGRYMPLFSIMGTKYGGNGKTDFALPSLANIGGCRHIICIQGMYERGDEDLPFAEPSANHNERMVGIITQTDGDVPEGWLPCDGRMLKSNQYETLFSLTGTAWGGNSSEFALPDIKDEDGMKYIICTSGRYPDL